MSKNASLHPVRRDGSVAIFRIDAPAVAAALSRKAKAIAAPGSRPVSTLGVMDISRTLLERLIAALGTSDLNFSRNEKGKWFVRAVLPKAAESVARVETNDTSVAGEHTCSACGGTGRYTQGYGICYRCKGKGTTTVADRRRNSRYEMHRRNRAEARLAGGA